MAEDTPQFFQVEQSAVCEEIGKDSLLGLLRQMVMIRQFEIRSEALYQQGKVGGFLHLYIGQEAVQTGAIKALGATPWYSTTYRCHALALLLGETPRSLFAELFGRVTGNAKGRGGSMHLYSNRMLGGFGIVAGQLPIATGAGFSAKYQKQKDVLSICFLGDGAVAQGVFHESLNVASMWSLPCMYVIENNKWSMGTPLCRTLTNYDLFPKKAAEAYDMRYFRLYGMDLLQCYAGFAAAKRHMLASGRPVLIECMTERFRGHSISDPALYRAKDELKQCLAKDPILLFKENLIDRSLITQEAFEAMETSCREEIAKAASEAESDPWPDPLELEDDVMAPQF